MLRLADWPMPLAFALIPMWYVPEYALALFSGWHMSLKSPFAWLLRDLMLPAFYTAAWSSTDFVWNGHQMSGSKQDDEPAGQTS